MKCANDKIYNYKKKIIEFLEIKLHSFSFIRINIFKNTYPLQYCFKTFFCKLNNSLLNPILLLRIN